MAWLGQRAGPLGESKGGIQKNKLSHSEEAEDLWFLRTSVLLDETRRLQWSDESLYKINEEDIYREIASFFFQKILTCVPNFSFKL